MAIGTIAYCSREDHWYPAFGHALAALVKQYPDVQLVHPVGTQIADQRNEAVRAMEGEWILFLDTDTVFAPDILRRLLARDVPVVQALQLSREEPHLPIPGIGPLVGEPGLCRAAYVGMGCTLIRRDVFDVLDPPWFVGALGHEDIYFSEKLTNTGVPLYCDTTVTVGHITPVAVMPVYDGQQWRAAYQRSNAKSAEQKPELIYE